MGDRDPSASAAVPVLVPPALPAAVPLGDLLATNEADAIPVGLADDTEHADFPVVWWQPGETGTWLFVGSPRAELDAALWSILRGVAERYSPEDVRLAVIDSSSRRLSFAEVMAHTDLVAQSDRVDLAAALIEQVATELRRRRAEPHVDRPGLVLLVSDLTQLRRRLADSPFSSAVDSLRTLGSGAPHGVNLVAIASTIDGTSELLAEAADVFVGLLTNSDEVAALGLDELAMSACGPGRCWSRASGSARAVGLVGHPVGRTGARHARKPVTMERVGRGDGIGIELTRTVGSGGAARRRRTRPVRAATEVGIRHFDDDRSVLDALIRLRAELGRQPRADTRRRCSSPAARCTGST